MKQHFRLQLGLTWGSWSALRQILPTLRPWDSWNGRVLWQKCCKGMAQWDSNYVPLNLPINSIYFNLLSLLLFRYLFFSPQSLCENVNIWCVLNPICPPASACFAASNKGCFLGKSRLNLWCLPAGQRQDKKKVPTCRFTSVRRFMFLFHNCSQVWCVKQLLGTKVISSHFEVTPHLKHLG